MFSVRSWDIGKACKSGALPWHHHSERQGDKAEPEARWSSYPRCKGSTTPGKAELILLEVLVVVGLLPGLNYLEKTDHM